MAIQLNDRDHLIFGLISEHQVLLEKHISWFISDEAKPVLIRDRLRKLFYLDYLLCQKHDTKLPWWTTPTKPLVYMLSPMSEKISGKTTESIDLFDAHVQRHYLEVANVRMLGLVAQRSGQCEGFDWITCTDRNYSGLDAIMIFRTGSNMRKVGLINHPDSKEELSQLISNALKTEGLDFVAITSRDRDHQDLLQKRLSQSLNISDLAKVLFITHHELYKFGICKANWRNGNSDKIYLLDRCPDNHTAPITWVPNFNQPHAASA